jgi:hypothetical protein
MSHSPRGDLHTDTHRAALGSSRGRRKCSCGVLLSRAGGYLITMTDDRTTERAADLLPEERSAGSADPRAQAEAILAESDEREEDLEAGPDSFVEHRRSDQTVSPDHTGSPDQTVSSDQTGSPGGGRSVSVGETTR